MASQTLGVLDCHCPPLSTSMNGRPLFTLRHITRCYSICSMDSPRCFEGPIPTPSCCNHASAINHPGDVKAYITTEIGEVAMLGPFPRPPFTHLCQTNPPLTHPKCNCTDRQVIMDLSWTLTPLISINSGTPIESFLGSSRRCICHQLGISVF